MWNRRKISIHRGMPHEPNTVAVVARKTFGGTLKIHAVLVPGIEALFWSRRALLAVTAAGLLRKPVGYLIGWITQPVGILLGLFTPAMYAIGAIFAGLWVLTFILGRRLDAQAAARAS